MSPANISRTEVSSVAMQFDEVLRTWKEFFEREGIRYAVAGGNALQAWGHARPTYDIDFVIDGRERRRVIRHAESLGYKTTYESEGYSNHDHPTLPGLDHARVREYFSQHGLWKIYDEIERERH
jgi:hypothetical protein